MKAKIMALWSKRWAKWALGAVVVVVLGKVVFGGAAPASYDLANVTKGSVVQVVTATGQIKPKSYASLHFKTTGSIARLLVEVGDQVVAGQTIAILDTGELSKKVLQAEADLSVAVVADQNAELEVADEQAKGKQSLAIFYGDVPNSLNDILNLSQQAYATFVSFYNSSNHLTSEVAMPILNSQLVVDANNSLGIAATAIASIRAATQNFSPSTPPADIDKTLIAIHQPLQNLQTSLSALISAVAAIPTGTVSAATLESYKTALATAQSNLNSAISKESGATADATDTKIQNTLSLNSKQASNRSAKANLDKAQAALGIAKQSLSDAYLRAPISGIIAAKSKQIGELVTSADQVYYLLGAGGLEVVANIPEVDIAKIKIGDSADLELDAYENGVLFKAVVSQIDPAETIVDGIATYKTTFSLVAPDPRLRSGMTATVRIETARRDGVLTLPQRAINTDEDGNFVRIQGVDDQDPIKKSVKTGLRGNKGEIEIVEGLSEGATVIVSTH